MPILADVETQWDLYLANTYSLEELQKQKDAFHLQWIFYSPKSRALQDFAVFIFYDTHKLFTQNPKNMRVPS